MSGKRVNQHIHDLISVLQRIDHSLWTKACDLLLSAYINKSNVWIGGNGGNSSNASHFATDWNKGLFFETGLALKSHTLWENSALVSAFANDGPFDVIYSDQLKMWAQPNDVAVLLTGGGISKNIIHAAETSRELGLKIIGLTGGNGLQFDSLYDIHIHIPSNDIQIVEDVHATFGHVVFKHILKSL